MNAFARYFLQLFQQIWTDIKEWFIGIWETLFKNIYENFVFYFQILKNNIDGFGFFGWVLFIISTALILFFLYFAVLRIIYFFKRYVRFQKNEMEKDDLREEIARLNQKVMETITEKNKILAMKVSQLGINPNESYDTTSTETKEEEPTRFAKLRSVDIRYDGRVLETNMMEDEKVPLSDLVTNFVNYSCSRLKLFYDPKIIRLYFASMATSKIIILEGISGTGKTSLPYAMAKFFKNNAAIVSVQPSWRDRAELLGYLNEFTKKFNETDFLKGFMKPFIVLILTSSSSMK
jgi:SpoVK/Ycf46/Vps4 family AAA+-type ATPase